VRLLRDVDGTDQLVTHGDPMPEFDVHCPLPSLPGATGTTLQTIPASIPYLSADSLLVESWRTRLTSITGRAKVGLTWAGGPAHKNDRNRSMPLAALLPLWQVRDVSYISLQKGAGADQVHSLPEGSTLTDWTADLNDFADTAALIQNLDLVITVDTSVGHLAGAMGKPVWVLLPFAPDWRWMLSRDDSPWYPTMRLFRQPTIGDWETPIKQVLQSLQSHFGGLH